MNNATLHGFFRSSASYRVRIALNLKGIPYDSVTYNLRAGAHRSSAYLSLNPQGLLPTLEIDRAALNQSLAICEYLDEQWPEPPLLPFGAMLRAKVRAFAQTIACEVHPLQNIGTLERLRSEGLSEARVEAWAVKTIEDGLEVCEKLIGDTAGPFAFGDRVSIADVALVPQLANARRFGVALRWPRLAEAEQACLALDAFIRAAPDNQADAPPGMRTPQPERAAGG